MTNTRIMNIFYGFIVMLFMKPQTIRAVEFPPDVLQAQRSIHGSQMVSHIDFLASEYCRGRETGEYGMKVAIAYLQSVFKGADLEPAGEYGSYSQPVLLQTVTLGDACRLKLIHSIKGVDLASTTKLEWDFLPISLSAEKESKAPIVFAGYGITAPDYKYDDYKNFDATNKIVLVMRHEPREKDSTSPFDGDKMSNYGTLLCKILNAQKHGAIGILFVTDPLNHKDLTPEATDGTYWPSLRRERMKNEEDFRFMNFRPSMRIVGDDYGVSIPALAVDSKLANELIGNGNKLEQIQEEIDKALIPHSFLISDKIIEMNVSFCAEPVEASNLIAKVTGSDPELKDEIVIVGAHYDHVGKNNRGLVYGGADDNASGTAAVLELARAFKNMTEKPKRTIIFILFTAEEKGLLGSRYYVKNPVYPLEKTIAAFDLDMIGRNDMDQISVLGRYQFPKLYEIIEQANLASVNMDINFSVEEFVQSSDHFPFMRNNIPSILFNSGLHDQYHRPEDTANRIIPDKLEKVTHLTFLSLWSVANLPKGVQLVEKARTK